MKKVLKFIVLALVAFMLVGCTNNGGGNEGGKEETAAAQEIVFWHTLTDHDFEMVQEIVDAFNAEYEGTYHVTHETQPLDGFTSKVYEAVTNGVGPNIVWLYPNTANIYVEEGLSLDYSQYWTDADYKNRVEAGVYNACTDYTDGGMHAAIATITGSIMFYNKELLEKYNLEIPQTWDELLAACKTVVDGEKAEGKDIMGFGPDSVDTLAIIALQQLGYNYIENNKTNGWTSDEFVNWVNWWKEAEKAGYFQLVDSEGYHSGPFGSQHYFCYMGSSAGLGYITPDGFTIVTGPVPQVDTTKPYTEITTRALVSFKEDEATDAGTAEFVKFFVKAEYNLPFCQKYSASTPFSDVQATPEYQEYFNASIAQQALTEMLPFAGTRANVANGSSADEALKAALRTAIIDDADTLETLTNAAATADAALAE